MVKKHKNRTTPGRQKKTYLDRINLLVLVLSVSACMAAGEIVMRNYLSISGDSMEDVKSNSWYNEYDLNISRERAYLGKDGAYYLTEELETDYALNKDRFKILVIGDSFTAGSGLVDESRRYSSMLQKKLGDRFFVINLAYGGAGSKDYLEISRLYFRNHSADLTIIGYFPNDIEPDIIVRRKFAEFFILSPLAKKSALMHQLKKSIDNGLHLYQNYLQDAYQDERNVAAHKETMAMLINYINSKNSNIMLLGIPFLTGLEKRELYPLQSEIDLISEIADERDIFFLDLYPYFEGKEPDSLWINQNNKHPNAVGHEIISNATFDNLAAAMTKKPHLACLINVS